MSEDNEPSKEMKSLREMLQEALHDPERLSALAGLRRSGVKVAASPPDVCPQCRGARWLRLEHEDHQHPDFGKIVPCPACEHLLNQKKLKKLHDSDNLLGKTAYEHMRFENFRPYPEQFAALTVCRRYAERPTERPMLTLCGQPGGGKSHLALAAAFYYFDHSKELPLVYTAQQLIARIIASYKVAADERGNAVEVLHSLKNARLLVIDEMGAHYATEHAEAVLSDVICTRYVEGLPTVITSNVPLADLGRRPGEVSGDQRIASRLLDYRQSTVLVLDVPDLRTKRLPAQAATAPLLSVGDAASQYHKNRDQVVVCPICHCRPHFEMDGVRCPKAKV